MSEFTRKMWSKMCRNHAYFSNRYGANLRDFFGMGVRVCEVCENVTISPMNFSAHIHAFIHPTC